MGRKLVISIGSAVALLVVVGCSTYRHCQWRIGDQAILVEPDYSLAFIEYDDEGWMWNRSQADSAMQLVREKAKNRDTVVLLFVHGWHHSAECCDGNVEGFRQTLKQLNGHLGASGRNFNVVGLYMGWRGRSLPSFLDYVTFWGRKGAAERIGENDMKEFIARLQELYVEYRPDAGQARSLTAESSATGAAASKNFLGMVILGHSFGSQVLFKAISGTLEDQFLRVNETPAYLRDAKPGTPNTQQKVTVSGIGDLVVLMNPALEASQYQRLDLLSRGLSYSPLQNPLILTVSAENDKARHSLFTIGRRAGELFTGKPRKANAVERQVERQALGVYPGHVTHRLIPTDDTVQLKSRTMKGDARLCNNSEACESDWYEWESAPTQKKPDSIRQDQPAGSVVREFDFSCEVVFNNVELSRLTDTTEPPATDTSRGDCRAAPFQPFIVAHTSKQIIDDHSGIFTQPFLDFLVPYIRYIEIKSLVNLREKERAGVEQRRVIEEKRPGVAR